MKKYRKIPSLKFLYEISNDGELRNVKSKRVLSFHKSKDGYTHITINNKTLTQTKFRRARLVAEAWCKIPPYLKDFSINELQVNHIDYDRSNDLYTNLEWVTSQENVLHSKENLYPTRKAMESRFVGVRLIELDKEFECTRDAAIFVGNKLGKTNINTIRRNIGYALKRRSTYAYGYHWELL